MIRIGILTCSDKGSKGERVDTSGPRIKRIIERLPVRRPVRRSRGEGGSPDELRDESGSSRRVKWEVIKYKIVPDEKKTIISFLKQWTDKDKLNLIFTTGGTGLSSRDLTPEATREVIEKEVPGLAEIMRIQGYRKTPFALLSRATAGVRKKTLIINLPGSEKAVKENLSFILAVLPHALEIIAGKTEHA